MEGTNVVKSFISFIIPTKDRSDILLTTIEKLVNALETFIHYEIIVVDDRSFIPIVVPNFNDRLRVIRNSGKGVASARNLGASESKGDLLWFIDDDIWISEEIIHRGLELHSQLPNSAFNFNWVYPNYLVEIVKNSAFGRFLISIDYTTMKGWCKGAIWDDNKLFLTDFVAGATLLIPKKIYDKSNGYNETFPLAGFEDYDFSIRLKNIHVESFIEPNYIAFHNEINKTNIHGFLKRTYNSALTRRHGLELGYKNQQMSFSTNKRIIYFVIGLIEPCFLYIWKNWPATSLFDFIYFKGCKALIGFYIYKGYKSYGVE